MLRAGSYCGMCWKSHNAALLLPAAAVLAKHQGTVWQSRYVATAVAWCRRAAFVYRRGTVHCTGGTRYRCELCKCVACAAAAAGCGCAVCAGAARMLRIYPHKVKLGCWRDFAMMCVDV